MASHTQAVPTAHTASITHAPFIPPAIWAETWEPAAESALLSCVELSDFAPAIYWAAGGVHCSRNVTALQGMSISDIATKLKGLLAGAAGAGNFTSLLYANHLFEM